MRAVPASPGNCTGRKTMMDCMAGAGMEPQAFNAAVSGAAATLASCASGIVTVNIDNGYGAACAALRALASARGQD